jgi:translation initiation factor eIF-2B subunit epsilon
MSINVKKELPNNRYGKQESLQAIVFADEFVHDLKPSEQVYPSVLLPVVTLPLLDYLLETLIRSRVQQVFLYCSSYVEKLKEFITSLKNFQDKNIIITPLISDGCRSLGDALRDIDTKGCIRDDFILIRGTAFTNIDLRVIMDLHRIRKEKDKNVALTILFRNLGNIKNSALKNESTLVISTANSRRLLFYKRLIADEKKIKLELQWFLDHDKVHINTAFLDTRIYFCSPSVLPLFADNFDFQVKLLIVFLIMYIIYKKSY